MRERLGVALAVAEAVRERGPSLGAVAAWVAYVAAMTVAVVILFAAAAGAGRSTPASPCWDEPTTRQVQACFARERRP